MARTLLISGFDLRDPELPPEAVLLAARMPLPAVPDFPAACASALEEPQAGQPLESFLRPNVRVAIVLDDPSLPLPQPSRDPRRDMLEAVLRKLAAAGIRHNRVTVLVANGLSRQWRPAELLELLGEESTSRYAVVSHDCEAGSNLLRLAEEPEGPVEFHKALVEADVLIHLNVVTSPAHAGLYGITLGATGYRTARFLGSPSSLAGDDAPLRRGSAHLRLHERVAAHLKAKVPVFQVSAVLNNELWNPTVAALLRSGNLLSRPIQMWNALPVAVRQRAARTLRSSARPIGVFAGPPEVVAQRALELFARQHEVAAPSRARVVVFGLPDIGPASVHASQNPVLASTLALSYVQNLFTERPLLEEGGVLVFANPLNPSFDRKAHLPHEEFYEKVLRTEREPQAIHERFEPYFAGRPEFVASYQRRYAFHGAHPLQGWYLSHPARRRAGKIIVAHGDPRACARLGFSHAVDVEDALARAREFLGEAEPSTAVLEVPPPFWTRVG